MKTFGEGFELLFMEMSEPVVQAVMEALDEEGLEHTHENMIKIYQENIDIILEELGDSLGGRMMTAMLQWFIDQEKLAIQVFETP